MSKQTPGGADFPDADRPDDDYPEKFAEEFGDDEPDRSRWPFIAALCVVGVALAVVLGVALIIAPEAPGWPGATIDYISAKLQNAKGFFRYIAKKIH